MLRDYEAVLKAAADPNRARILKMLEGSELCVCQIVAVLGLSQPSVSKHLTILRDAELIEERKEGRWVYLRQAQTARNEFALPLLALLPRWLKDDSQVAEDAQRVKIVSRIPADQLCSISCEDLFAAENCPDKTGCKGAKTNGSS
jgi:ArsR family transcriptional regulator, arsenate/arsenite/antimonite-responsive transcriptional repressor